MHPVTDADIDVPPGETPGASCQYCGRPFDEKRARDLHVGEVHEAEATEEEIAIYEAAADSERDELFFYHVKVVVALGIIYSGLVILYMAALGSGFL